MVFGKTLLNAENIHHQRNSTWNKPAVSLCIRIRPESKFNLIPGPA